MTKRWWGLVGAVALSQAGCADPPSDAPPAQTAADAETASSEAPVASATGVASSDLAAVLSASTPPSPKPSATADDREAARKAAMEKELAALDVQMMAALNRQGSATRDLLRGGEVPPNLLDQAAQSGVRAGSGHLSGDPKVGTGSGGGGLASLGDSGVSILGNKIGGKTAKELTAADLDKALGTAGCATTRLDSPLSSSGAPSTALFEAKCSDKTFNITFVPSGVTLPNAETLADMEKKGATWKEDGMLLAILPKEKGARSGALELMKKLRSSGTSVKGNVAVGGATVSGGSVSNASAVVAAMAAGFRRCYNRGLQEDPAMKGSMKVTAGIGPNGEVLSAAASGGDTLSAVVKSCVSARVSAAQFASPDGGPATITIPVSFFQQ